VSPCSYPLKPYILKVMQKRSPDKFSCFTQLLLPGERHLQTLLIAKDKLAAQERHSWPL
jgi:hypothetical protein